MRPTAEVELSRSTGLSWPKSTLAPEPYPWRDGALPAWSAEPDRVRAGDVVLVSMGDGLLRIRADAGPESPGGMLCGVRLGQRVRWRSSDGPVLIKVIGIAPTAAIEQHGRDGVGRSADSPRDDPSGVEDDRVIEHHYRAVDACRELVFKGDRRVPRPSPRPGSGQRGARRAAPRM